MKWTPPKLPHSAPLVLLVLMVGAVAVVSHLVRRFNANQQALGRRLYDRTSPYSTCSHVRTGSCSRLWKKNAKKPSFASKTPCCRTFLYSQRRRLRR